MNKRLLMLIIFFIVAIGNAQEKTGKEPENPSKKPEDVENKLKINTNVFKINLSAPSKFSVSSSESTMRMSIRSRDLLQFKLVGGNPLKYKYVLNNKLVNFFEDKSNNPIENIQRALTPEKPNIELTAEEIVAEDKNNEIKLANEINRLKNSVKTLSTQADKNKDIIEKVKDTLSNNEELKKELKNKSYDYLSIHSFKILMEEQGTPKHPTTIDEDKKNIIYALKSLDSKILSLNDLISEFKMQCNASEELTETNYRKDLKDLFSKFKTIITDFRGIKSDVTRFDKMGKEYEALENNIRSQIIEINKVFTFLYSIKFDNYTIPTDVNGKNIDVVLVSLERFDINNPIALDKHTYNIWIKGGFKIDISGGVFLTSLVNNEYYTNNVIITLSDGNKLLNQTIGKREKGNYEFGFGSTINISHRSASWVNPTLNVGALFTVNQQFQLLTGLGLILGKEERIIFSSGLAMGRVTKISEAFKADGTTNYDLGEGVVPTSSQFDFGYYFGITYNFSKSKKVKSE